jgi:hypothetical protein
MCSQLVPLRRGQTVTITSTTDQKLAKLRQKEKRKVGRRIAQGEGEPLLEWLAASGVGFAAISEVGLYKLKTCPPKQPFSRQKTVTLFAHTCSVEA